MLRKTGYALAGLLMVIGSSAMAANATLKSMTGSVLADTGNGFQEASAGMALGQGDRVMANAGSELVLKYDNGCEETVVGEKIITISEACKAAVLAGANGLAVGTIVTYLTIGAIATDGGSGDNRPVSP